MGGVGVTSPGIGDTVRATIVGKYAGTAYGGNHLIHIEQPGQSLARVCSMPVETASVSVLKKAVPLEPKLGSVVEFPDGTVWAHWATYTSAGWVELPRQGNGSTAGWQDLVEKHGYKWVPWVKTPLVNAPPPWVWDPVG